MNRPRLRLTLSDQTNTTPPMPLEWWRLLPYEGYYEVPDYTNWWPIKEDDPKPDYNDDMRC